MFRRWKCFVGGNVSSVEMFRRWKCFVGGNVSSVEMFRRWKIFVGGNFISSPNFRHFPLTKMFKRKFTLLFRFHTWNMIFLLLAINVFPILLGDSAIFKYK